MSRCGIDECEFASNMKDRPMSRCLKYDDASECTKWCKKLKERKRKARLKAIKENFNNYNFTPKVMAWLKRKKEMKENESS